MYHVARQRVETLREFWERHVVPERPVIIPDLYDGQAVRRLEDLNVACAELGSVSLKVGPNYYDSGSLVGTPTPGDTEMTLATYFDRALADPTFALWHREGAMPPELGRHISPPAIAHLHDTEPLRFVFYAATAGTVAPLHIDGDQRDNLFTLVSGEKQIYLIHRRYSARLYPFKNMSGIALHQLPESERRAFLAFNQAYECTLKAGETLYIPRYWWHTLYNLTPTIAFGIRLPRTRTIKRLRALPHSYRFQHVCGALVDRRTGEVQDRAVYDRLFATYFRRYPTSQERLVAFTAFVAEAHRQLCPDVVQGDYIRGRYDASWPDELLSLEHIPRYYAPSLTLSDESLDARPTAEQLATLRALLDKAKRSPDELDVLARSLDIAGDPTAPERQVDAAVLAEYLERRADW